MTTSATGTKKATTATTASKTKQTIASGIQNVVQAPPSTVSPAIVQPGGTFTYLKATDPASLDPAFITYSAPTDGVESGAIFDELVFYNSSSGTVTPQTAQSLTSSDGVVWTLKLRPSIKFSDGTPYDAAAVAFNWNRIGDPKTASSLATFVNQIQALDVVDATTLRVTLKVKNGSFPTSVVQLSLIGSPTAIQQRGAQFANNPVGAGPFVLKSWARGNQMVLTRNTAYWNAPLPYLDQVIVKPIVDEQQRLNTLTSGDATMLWTRSTISEQGAEKAGNVVPHVLAQSGGTNMYFNTKKAPFNDVRARQAFTMALDRVQYAKVVNSNVTPPEHSIFLEQSPFYDQAITQLPYDAAKAQQLFDQVAADTGGPVTFTIMAFQVQTQITQSEYMQGVLNQFRNVKVNVDQVAVANGISRLNSGDFQVALAGLYWIDPEPIFTAKFVCNASPSFTGWCDPKFDADVADAKATLDPNQRIADVKDMQKIFYAAVPSLFYDRGYSWMIGQPNIQNFDYVNDGWVLLDRLWLKTR